MSNAKSDGAIKPKKKKIWRSQQRLSAKHTIINRFDRPSGDKAATKWSFHLIFAKKKQKIHSSNCGPSRQSIGDCVQTSEIERENISRNSNTNMRAVCSGTQATTHFALSFRFSAFIFAFEIYICVSCSLTRQYTYKHSTNTDMHGERARDNSHTHTNAAGGVVCARFANKMRKFANVLDIGFGFSARVTVSVCSEQRIEWEIGNEKTANRAKSV